VGWITDTHCHLNLDIFQPELGEILERAWARGLGRILVPGIDIPSSRSAVALAERFPNLYAAVGVHPEEANSWNAESLSILRDLAQNPKVVAIGEIGLDYYHDTAPHSLQRDIFQAQLNLAEELGRPVVLHQRQSWDDFWEDCSAWRQNLCQSGSPLAQKAGVLHSFDGTLPAALEAIQEGFFIGISGPVTFKNAKDRQEVVTHLPLDRILIETDSPYLTPHPLRGRWPNEPANVALVAEKIASLHDQPLETVIQATWQNAVQLFDWGVNS
jgi:TatD DNase family protein